MPKFNMYQSLHTTVLGPEGKPVELQIRTDEMHRGPSSAWRRTGSTRRGKGIAVADRGTGDGGDLIWVRQLLDWQRETADPGEFLDSLRFEINSTEVYAFTPKGDVHVAAAGLDAGRLRVRDPHRGRATGRSAPGSTVGWCRWSRSCATATWWRSSPPRPRTPDRAGTGWRS